MQGRSKSTRKRNTWINMGMAVTTSIPHCTRSPTYCNKARRKREREREKDIKIKKEQVKLSYFTDDIIVCV